MKALLKLCAIASTIIFSSGAQAYLECGSISVKGLTVQASRENGSAFENTMRIVVSSGACEGVTYAYLKNDHPAYAGILSVILAAQASNQNISVYVKEADGIIPGAKEIEWVSK
ncbi:hypothetical protein ACJJH9_11175 [Microbulbifer sp. DLAB2-AF]|uniref:hypothetical protein n=1 Tax=Microbulbifer sp. DLAB2-AF TaxID=3243395 RepID=UPI00403A1819